MKVKILAILLLIVKLSFGQDSKCKNELIELGKIYRYHGNKEYSASDVEKKVNAISSAELTVSKKFIAEAVNAKSNIGAKEYLIKPDSLTLKYLYVIRGINYNLYENPPKENAIVLDSLLNENTNYHELLSSYYGMIFSRLTTRGDGFNMADVDFKPNEYNLINDTEKSVFFLNAMERLGALIWGYMNIPQPPNYKLALEFINKYPRFNGQPYYQFTNLDLKDFNITTDKRRPKESFKKYYLTNYMTTLIYHLVCLSQPDSDKDKKQDVLNKSIIKNETYWQYYKQPEVLNAIFKGK